MKQICISFPRIAVSESEAALSEALSAGLNDILRATPPFTMVVGSPVVQAKAFVDDQVDSQITANGLAQGMYYATGNMANYHAAEIADDGTITELVNPTPGPL